MLLTGPRSSGPRYFVDVSQRKDLMGRFSIPTITLLAAAALLLPPGAAAQDRGLARHLDRAAHRPAVPGPNGLVTAGHPLASMSGLRMLMAGGNAADAAVATLATLNVVRPQMSGMAGNGFVTVYDRVSDRVYSLGATGAAPLAIDPSSRTAEELNKGIHAGVVPGLFGGWIALLDRFGTMSLEQVLAPAIDYAENGHPIEPSVVASIESHKELFESFPSSLRMFLPLGRVPEPGENFRMPDLANTLRKVVEAEQTALAAGKTRSDALQAAFDRFYRGDIAEEMAGFYSENGGDFTMEDFARYEPIWAEPVHTTYRGYDVYTSPPTSRGGLEVTMQLNLVEGFDLGAFGPGSAETIHLLAEAIKVAKADIYAYVADPALVDVPVDEMLSKDYARQRATLIREDRNDPDIGPGDPYPFQGGENPFREYLDRFSGTSVTPTTEEEREQFIDGFLAGTTSIQAADASGWVVSVTPSGGWLPAVLAGETGIGLSQRMQSFVLDPAMNPYNVLEPGKRPRATLTPSLALKDGEPFLSFAVQGGDGQDQNLLQFFLNVVEFGMNVQEAAEAANFNSYQLRSSFGAHESEPGSMLLNDKVPEWIRNELTGMGYSLRFSPRTSGPINAIWFDREHGTFWGGSSQHGDDYGVAW